MTEPALLVEDLVVSPTSTRLRWRGHDLTLPLGGRFNVSNALAAVAAPAGIAQ